MVRRAQFIPWKVAGRAIDRQDNADRVVQTTGWVFNNKIGDTLTLADFVATGDHEVPLYLDTFGLTADGDSERTLVEIGAGIGRMTCSFSRSFGTVYACDLDAGILERCREAVARYGKVERLRTVQVSDGRTLDLPDGIADAVFSYITLQHCDRSDAQALVREAVRITRPGGWIALNFRTSAWSDVALLPLGVAARAAFQLPGVGGQLSRRRLPTRLAWQVNRLDPHQVIHHVDGQLDDVAIWRNPARAEPLWGVDMARLEYFHHVNRSHWWLVGRVSTSGSPEDG